MTDAMDEDGTVQPKLAEPRHGSVVERSISPISGRFGSVKGGKAIVFAGLVAGCGVFVAASWGHETPTSPARRQEPARQIVPFEPLHSANAPTLAAPGTDAPSLVAADPATKVPAIQQASYTQAPPPADRRRTEAAAIRGAPLLAFSRGEGQRSAFASSAPETRAVSASLPATELDELRRGSAIGRAQASRLPDRNFLIVAGTPIPCVLQTAMDTATPGYVSCLIPRDVLSDNGAVVLMEKGTKVLGEYRSSLKQGQRRLFVLWTRAVTPGGVAVSLASPAADALGRAGFDGDIDNHFWARFGGALLLSIVDDGAYAAAGRGGDAPRLPSDAAAIAVQNSVAIPPSLRKAHGSQVAIFVAQDFDFSGVYGLKAR